MIEYLCCYITTIYVCVRAVIYTHTHRTLSGQQIRTICTASFAGRDNHMSQLAKARCHDSVWPRWFGSGDHLVANFSSVFLCLIRPMKLPQLALYCVSCQFEWAKSFVATLRSLVASMGTRILGIYWGADMARPTNHRSSSGPLCRTKLVHSSKRTTTSTTNELVSSSVHCGIFVCSGK